MTSQIDRLNAVFFGAIKNPCVAASTVALVLNGLQTVDGVAVVAGNRVLVKNQASAVNNGIYVADTGDWSRDVDFDGPREVMEGTLVKVNAGTQLGFWYVTSTGGNVPGTDSITFGQASSSLAVISAFWQSVIGLATAALSRAALGAAASGANTDITSLNGPALGSATATTPAAGDNDTSVATSAFVTAAVTNVFARSHLAGLGMSTAGASTTMSIAAGQAADTTNTALMALTAIDKTTAAWVVGNAQGGKAETGAAANNTFYHWYVIRRPDTGVVDVCFSTSATGLTAGSYVSGGGNVANAYTQYRRIGSIKTNGSAQWTSFVQDGDMFELVTLVADISSGTAPGTAAITRTLASVPTGINVIALLQFLLMNTGTGAATLGYLSDLATTDSTPSISVADTGVAFGGAAGASSQVSTKMVRTNTSAQIRARVSFSDGTVSYLINTLGWIDSRGRNA